MMFSTDNSPDSRVQRYVRSGHRRVDGWLSRLDARLIAEIGRFQKSAGVTGSVGEIGVHHGRLFILLALLRKPGEPAFAVDLFDDQEANIDGSGCGDETAFRANLDRFGVDAATVRIIKGNSLDLDWPAIAAPAGPAARLFSVDGGHTAETTRNDVRIADSGLADGGVLLLDDYFNPEFPAVSEGMCRHMIEDRHDLAPIAIGDNKLLLCRPAWAERYRTMLLDRTPRRNFVRVTVLFGRPVAVFRTPGTLMQRIRQTEIARRLSTHPIGRALKPIVRRFLQG